MTFFIISDALVSYWRNKGGRGPRGLGNVISALVDGDRISWVPYSDPCVVVVVVIEWLMPGLYYCFIWTYFLCESGYLDFLVNG